MLTDKYLDGVPEGSRASQDKSLAQELLTDEALEHVRALNDLARERGQTLAQMALSWAPADRSRSRTARRRWTTSTSPRTSSRRSTGTPSTPGSTCGGPRARRAATIPDPTTSRQLTPKDFFAGACS